jgi:hypothetical protein
LRPLRVQLFELPGKAGAGDAPCSALQGLSAGSVRWHARCNVYLVG